MNDGLMKRRDLLAGLAIAAVELDAQEHNPESLYIPKPHRVNDRKFLHDFMDEFSFVDLVTATPSLRITHIPVLVDRTAGRYGTIRGHISRQNPQSATFDGQHPAVIVFRGPHAYISPTWYTKTEAVPTWNFAVVHASGNLRSVNDKKAMHDFLQKLIDKFENYDRTKYDFSKLPDGYVYGMIGGIIGFEMEIESLEGKFKLGQERSAVDKESVLSHLRSRKPERSISDLTAGFYERPKESE